MDEDNVVTVDVYAVQPNEIRAMIVKIDRVVPEEVAQELENICQIEDHLQWRDRKSVV